MIAVDTNILVYSHRPEPEFHEAAFQVVRRLAEGDQPWCIPWPCAHEFLAVVTSSRIFVNPTPLADALRQVALWNSAPGATFISEPRAYLPILQALLQKSAVTGPKVHDARIAAICIANGVSELYSADRDFSRFGNSLKIVNPL